MADDPLGIRIGGVLRCCLATYEKFAPPASVSKEGDTLDCMYCPSGIIVREGAWEWRQGYTQPEETRSPSA